MPEKLYNRILRIIEEQAIQTGAYPDYVRLMRLSLLSNHSTEPDNLRSRLLALPGLCCEAVEGRAEHADQITSSWLCFYQAAHLMDSVQDRDNPDHWWADHGPPLALVIASGLYFTASLILQQLHQIPAMSEVALEISQEFYRSFFVMNIGQYQELINPVIGLEQYWQNALAKSGAFFALACWSGARLGTSNLGKLGLYHRLGENLGLLIQVKDDLDEVQPLPGSTIAGQRPNIVTSLPVIYALEVLPPDKKNQLQDAIKYAPINPEAASEIIRLLDGCGTSTYVLAEIDRLRKQAIDALIDLDPDKSIKENLQNLIYTI